MFSVRSSSATINPIKAIIIPIEKLLMVFIVQMISSEEFKKPPGEQMDRITIIAPAIIIVIPKI